MAKKSATPVGEMQDRLLSINEAAQFLCASRTLVYALMDKGELAYSKIGGRRKVSVRDLLVMAERNRVGARG